MARLAIIAVVLVGCGFDKSLAGSTAGDDTMPMPDSGSTADCTPQFRGSTTAIAPMQGDSSADSIVVATPAGVTTNDVMLAIVVYQSDSDEPIGSVSAPSGWIRIEENNFSGDGALGQSLFWKLGRSGEPATIQFDRVGGSKRFIVNVLAYTNADLGGPIVTSSGQENSGSVMVTASSITATSCSRVVGAFGSKSVSTFTPPAPMTERVDLNTDVGGTLSLETGDAAMDGPTGPCAAQASMAADNIGQLVALRPKP